MSTIQDTDLLLVNRGGTDHKVTVEDLHKYLNPKPPWEEGDIVGILHVIVDNPYDIWVSWGKFYNKDSWEEVPFINAPGEWIIALHEQHIQLFVHSKGNWEFGSLTDTSKVTNMDSWFFNAKFNSDISNWDVSNVTNMNQMFRNTEEFNQDLSQWCVSKVTDYSAFANGNDVWEAKNKPVWGTCPRGEDKP